MTSRPASACPAVRSKTSSVSSTPALDRPYVFLSAISASHVAEQRLIDAAHSHRVDHDLGAVSGNGHNLQEVGGPVGTEVGDRAVIVLRSDQGMVDRVLDVLVADTVLPG